jgi:hypothetical protein
MAWRHEKSTNAMAGVLQEAEVCYSYGAPESTPGFWWGPCCSYVFIKFCNILIVGCCVIAVLFQYYINANNVTPWDSSYLLISVMNLHKLFSILKFQQRFVTLTEHLSLPPVFGGVHVVHMFLLSVVFVLFWSYLHCSPLPPETPAIC